MDKNIKFIEDSIKIHGHKYDYSKVNYSSNRIDVEIVCSEHGSFFQKPHNHLVGKGCSSCSRNKKMTLEDFIKKSIERHSNKYNYSEVDFKDSKSAVKIICPLHGVFEQVPNKHLSGSGCFKCGGSEKSNTNEFIERSSKIHNNIYGYEKVNYINNKLKIEVICKKHGSFLITPSNHLKGVGCSKCSGKRRLTNEEFIEKSILINGDKYSYEKCNYVSNKNKVIITCKKHGDFKQVANQHLSGSGCSRCKESIGEYKIEQFLILKKLKYKKQYMFEDLKYKKNLKFDFAIFSEEKLNFLIEFNGEQHYLFRGQYGMSRFDFDEILFRDKLKMEYCEKNKIKIFIIRYDEDLDLRLSEIFT